MFGDYQKKTITAILIIVFLLSFCVSTYAAAEETATSEAPAEEIVPTAMASFFSEEKISDNNSIQISSLDDMRKIGREEAYPADGKYELLADINGMGSAIETIPEFSGTFNGNNHKLSNIQLQGGGLFKSMSGTVTSLSFVGVTVQAADNMGVLAETVENGAVITDVFIEGSIEKREEGTNGSSGGLAAITKDAAKIENVQVYVLNPNNSKRDGAIVGSNNVSEEVYANCAWSSFYTANAFGLDSAVNEAAGVTTVKSQPHYLTLDTRGKRKEVTENTKAAETLGLVFKEWICAQVIVSLKNANDKSATVISGDIVGAENIISVYKKEWADGTATEVKFVTPVIVSENVVEEKTLEPVDKVFPTQIEEVKKIDSTLPMQIENEMIEITTWEQFKNIGNTEYDLSYTLERNYILMADISSDGQLFQPIGTPDKPFTGTFDGNGFRIDLNANPEIDQEQDYYGLFGTVR